MGRLLTAICATAAVLAAQTNSPDKPTWWAKYQALLQNGADAPKSGASFAVGNNVDMSNECGPQSETAITVNTGAPANLVAGSNDIVQLPMRGYYSFDGGATWGSVNLPLPPAIGANGYNFGSDPGVAFDTKGNVYYSYIVVYFGAGNGINGTSMAVAKSTDGGRTYRANAATYFSYEGGENHFNDKPMIAVDTNLASPYRDRVYVAWDAATGGSTGGGVRAGYSADGGATFAVTRVDDPSGPGRAIGAVPFVGPGGQVYVAWNDYAANTIAFNRSFDGGATWDSPQAIASKKIAFDIAIPAEKFRAALVYPSCDADRSSGPHRGRLYCSWMDLTPAGTTDIFASYSDDLGATWSAPAAVTDALAPALVDRFNQWLSVDPVTGDVNVSFYDTRNDTTGSRYMTDIYFSQSSDGGASWLAPNTRVSSTSSDEYDCNGLYPCSGIDYGNQQGDYSGLVSFGGVSHPVWTDSREQLSPMAGCRRGLAMEEVFTATVAPKKRR